MTSLIKLLFSAGGWLISIPGRAVSFVKTKPQLSLSYLIIGLLLIMSVFAMNLWGRTKVYEVKQAKTETELATVHTEKAELASRLNVVESVNQAQEATIDFLTAQREIDSKALEALGRDNKRIDANNQQAKTRLSILEKNDAQVREYINGRIPDGLRRLLNESRPKGTAHKTGD